MGVESINSILVADIGNVHTRLVLVDLVEGQYRLIASARARTTAAPPLNRAGLGVEHAARQMTETIGREIVGRGGEGFFLMPESGGHGIDAFLATGSAGRPMRVFLVGLTPELSLASARRVLAGSYVTLTDVLSPDDRRSEEDQINAVLNSAPDLILIAGGTDDGADELVIEMVRRVERALALIRRGTMPGVLYAGNQALQRHVKALLGRHTSVFVAKNVRPRLDQEQLLPAQIELALVYDEIRAKNPGGFDELGRYSQVGVVPTTQGYISTLRYMSALSRKGGGPLCVDVGSANSLLVAGLRQTAHYTIRPDVGVGHNLPGALAAVTPDRVRRWLPFEIGADELWDYAYDKQLRPATIPGTAEDLLIEQAVAREIVRLLVDEARADWLAGNGRRLPPFQPIIGAGAILTEAQHPGISAMLLLDALQPAGMVELALDPHNLLSALGVAAYLKPIVTVQALEAGGLVSLGTAFCPLGRARRGATAMTVRIRPAGGQTINRAVKGGELWMAPVLPGVSADVMIRLRRGLSIEGKRRLKRRVVAGAAGIIFDARGRPLVLPRPKERAARFREWQTAMLGFERRPPAPQDEAIPIPDDPFAAEGDAAPPAARPFVDLEEQEEDRFDALLS